MVPLVVTQQCEGEFSKFPLQADGTFKDTSESEVVFFWLLNLFRGCKNSDPGGKNNISSLDVMKRII